MASKPSKPSSQRPRRFAPFLKSTLEMGVTDGMKWVDRENKIFGVVWRDGRNKTSASENNPMFKRWAIYNNRYKPDKEHWSDWKQTFKGALERCPDIQKVWELTDRSFKVYKFGERINIHKVQRDNNDKMLADTRKNHQEVVSPRNVSPGYRPNNIPNIVIDELNWPCQISHQMDKPPMTDCHNGPSHPSTSMTMPDNYNDQQQNIDHERQYRLDSDELNGFFQQSSSMEQAPLSSSEIPDCFKENGKPLVRFQVYYSDIPVQTGTINNSIHGLRLFYGLKPQSESQNINIYGPKDFVQWELPDVTQCNRLLLMKKQNHIECIKTVLDKMERGLLFYSDEKKLYVQRLCLSRVFAWSKMYGSIVLNRKNKNYQQLFDMNEFQARLDIFRSDRQNQVCPSPTVILTFGQEYAENIINKSLLVHLEMTYIEAEELLQREMVGSQNDTLHSLLNSEDRELIQMTQTLKLSGSSYGQ